jgi:hypothetical protein
MPLCRAAYTRANASRVIRIACEIGIAPNHGICETSVLERSIKRPRAPTSGRVLIVHVLLFVTESNGRDSLIREALLCEGACYDLER